MAKRKVKLEVEVPDDDLDQAAKPAKKSSRLWWLASRLLVLLILLGGLVALAPTIVSATGVWKSLFAWAAPEVADKVEIGSLSLHWWSPIEVQGLVVRDPDGQPLAEVKTIRTQKTLLELAGNYQDLGTIEVTEPRAKVILRPDGTNIEDFVAKLPKSKDDKAQAPIGFTVVVTNGAVEFDDRIAGRQWSLDNLHVDLAWPAAADQPKAGKLSAALKPAAGTPASSLLGEIGADFSWQPGAGEQATLGAGHAQIKLTGLATEVAEGALRRYAADIRPAGALMLDAAYQWTDDGKSSHVTLRQLTAPQLTVASSAYLQSDQLTATITAGTADVLIDNGNLDIKQLRFESNLVELSGSGTAALQALTSGDVLKSVGSAGGPRAEVTGQINLAELARQLPATLRMKEGTQLTDGRVQLSLVSQTLPDGLRWQGWLKTDKLQGLAAGRPIAFNQPLELDFTIGQTSRGPTIDRLAGSSSFFKLEGSGSLDAGSLNADVDLNRLAAELGQFINWGETKLAGTLDAKLRWQRGQGSAWGGNADAHVRNFELAAAGLARARERSGHDRRFAGRNGSNLADRTGRGDRHRFSRQRPAGGLAD